MKEFYLSAASFLIFHLSVGLPFVICGMMVGNLGSSLSIAVFGLSVTFISMFYSSILNPLTDTLSVFCTRYYGRKEYSKVAGGFWKVAISLILLNVIFYYLVCWSYGLMMALSIDEQVALFTSEMLFKSLPYLCIQSVNNALVSFMAVQGISEPFIYINTVSIFVVSTFGHYFIVKLNYNHIGYVYAKFIQEGVNLIIYVIILIRRINRETIQPPSFALIADDFRAFYTSLTKTVLCYYGEALGFEITTYFAALLHSVSELALYCTYVNFTYIVYIMACGIATPYRIGVGKLMGAGLYRKAKTLSQHYFIYSFPICILTTLIYVTFKYEIAYIYTGDELLASKLATIISLYCVMIYAGINFYSACAILRTLGFDDYILNLTTIGYPLLMAMFSYLFCFVFGLRVYGLVGGFIISKTVIYLTMMWKIYYQVDWSKPLHVIHSNEGL